jgi:hypothetical protein
VREQGNSSIISKFCRSFTREQIWCQAVETKGFKGLLQNFLCSCNWILDLYNTIRWFLDMNRPVVASSCVFGGARGLETYELVLQPHRSDRDG